MNFPERIGRYRIEGYLGGGMGSVYRAHDPIMGRTVAIKVLKETNNSEEAQARFLQEAQAAARLAHENVMRVYDFGRDDQNRPFLVMEYVVGQDLGHSIKEGYFRYQETTLGVAVQIARALDHIHSHGVIHRDIKPSNIFITQQGVVKLMDFGIAKLGSASMTQTGFALGTPLYMAPEQIRAEPATVSTDIHAFGVLLYELVTGTKAFYGDSYDAIFYKILNVPIDLERLQAHPAGRQLSALIARCTSKTAEARPHSFAEILSELNRLSHASPVRSSDLSAPESPTLPTPVPSEPLQPGHAGPRLRRRALWFAGGALVLSLLSLAGYWITVKPPASVPGARKPAAHIQTSTGDMFLVPGGEFLSGEEKQPASLPDFYVDQTEVSNAVYARFCRATGHPLPKPFPGDRPQYPVVNVTFTDAEAFARWAGKRLPTSIEWEKAFRGTDGRPFPWGDSPDPARANVKNPTATTPGSFVEVTSFPNNASPFRALNMVGNAWEFVNEQAAVSEETLNGFRKLNPALTASDKWIRIRGGSYAEPLNPDVAWNSSVVPASLSYPVVGFRCVQDPPSAAR